MLLALLFAFWLLAWMRPLAVVMLLYMLRGKRKGGGHVQKSEKQKEGKAKGEGVRGTWEQAQGF